MQRVKEYQGNSGTTKHGFRFNIPAVEKVILLHSSVGGVPINKVPHRKR
jgi:hypothetical protein